MTTITMQDDTSISPDVAALNETVSCRAQLAALQIFNKLAIIGASPDICRHIPSSDAFKEVYQDSLKTVRDYLKNPDRSAGIKEKVCEEFLGNYFLIQEVAKAKPTALGAAENLQWMDQAIQATLRDIVTAPQENVPNTLVRMIDPYLIPQG